MNQLEFVLVLMSSKLPLLWKLLNGHGDSVDKELDAAILVQTTWRAKKEHRKYMAMAPFLPFGYFVEFP